MKPSLIHRNWLFLVILILSSYSCTKETVISEKTTVLPHYEIVTQQAADSTVSISEYNNAKALFEANNINISDFQIKRNTVFLINEYPSTYPHVICTQFVNGLPVLGSGFGNFDENLIFVFNDKGIVVDTIGTLLTDTAALSRYKNIPHLTKSYISSCILSKVEEFDRNYQVPLKTALLSDTYFFNECIFNFEENGQSNFKHSYVITLKNHNMGLSVSLLEY